MAACLSRLPLEIKHMIFEHAFDPNSRGDIYIGLDCDDCTHAVTA